MSKINNLKLSNFKFFKDEEIIHLNGKHLLLYGENGSGKSSFFWGLYTLLEASMKTSDKTNKYFKSLEESDESLVNIYANEMSCITSRQNHRNSYIELEDVNSIKYTLSLLDSSICGDTGAKESRKATDFINYQAIFKFQEFRNSETPDLYDVFYYSILPYVNFSTFTLKGNSLSNASDMWKAYQDGPGTTTNDQGNTIQVYKGSADYKNFLSFEKHFNNEFARMIDFVNQNSSEIIRELGYDIEFKIEYFCPEHNKRYQNFDWNPFRIGFCISKYNGKDVNIKRPQTFLNEAKMAAVATAIRLAILNFRINTAASDALKVLVLDDMMISLDMSNRDSLMNLLLKEYSDKYQILFLTHDKSLYNFVDYKIKQYNQGLGWIRKEMYIGECDIIKEDFPVIIDGECSSFEKAKKYYAAKDFTTTSIYVRQTLEQILSSALPDELKRKADDKFVSLEDLWRTVKERHKLDQSIIGLFEQSKRVILNPSAHYQKISQPIYRRELLEAFKLLKELQKLDLSFDTLLIEKCRRIIFKHPSENYTFEFELESDMVIKAGTQNDPKCKIHTWQYNGTEFYDFKTKGVNDDYSKCKPKFSKLKQGLFNQPFTTPVDNDCFLDNTTIEKGTLREIFI